MDITTTTEPRSDQINYDHVATHNMTVTITEVKAGSKEQPVELHLKDLPGKPYKPGRSMRRVLVAAWGADASKYVGRQITLYGDPTIKFGKEAVGGIRIAKLSHINAPVEVLLTVTRGHRTPFVVQPLDAPDDGTVQSVLQEIENAESIPALKTAWDLAGVRGVQSHPDIVAAKDARKIALEPPVGS